MKEPENPHAFPSTYKPYEGYHEPGITLRDYFAAKAMQALIGRGVWTKNQITEQAYNMADGMLTEREKNQEQ